MTGHYVERKAGWDTHGLPVEIAVEQKLGFTSKDDIERYGIAEFNAPVPRGGARAPRGLARADRADRLLGRHRRRVLHARPELHRVGLVGAEDDVGPRPALRGPQGRARTARAAARRSPRTRSRRATRTSRTRRSSSASRSREPAGALREGDTLLVWTTTPWTLVSNAAVAVDPELTYVRTANGEVLAEALVERVLGEAAEIVDRFPGSELIGAGYEPPFAFIARRGLGPEGATRCCPATSSPPTTAPASSTRRSRSARTTTGSARSRGSNVVNPVRLDGTYDERIGPYAGRWVKDADADLVEDLRARGRLLRAETLLHAYPHCWRCGTPLLYYAKPSWYIRTSAMRDRLLAANETVEWYPPHIKHGRFGKLAGEQRRLGDLARALLGHAAAGLALRERPRRGGRLVRRGRGALGRARCPIRTGRTSTSTRGRARSAAARCAACPR